MNRIAITAAAIACTLPAFAQDSRTGIATPPPMLPEGTQTAGASAAIDGYRPTPTVPALQVRREPAPRQQNFTGNTIEPMPGTPDRPSGDPDANIVTSVPHEPNVFPIGTQFKVRMHETISTSETPVGSPFSAELTEPVTEEGRILIPAGTLLSGRVTEVHGGRRIAGRATLHLDPTRLTLPDGSVYAIRAQVVDTSESFATRIDSEGTIVRRDHIKGTLAVMSLTTGSAAAAGAALGGGVGALVGAGIGAGVSTAWWLKQDRQTTLPRDTAVTFYLNEPFTFRASAR